jgi:hypothetical protein
VEWVVSRQYAEGRRQICRCLSRLRWRVKPAYSAHRLQPTDKVLSQKTCLREMSIGNFADRLFRSVLAFGTSGQGTDFVVRPIGSFVPGRFTLPLPPSVPRCACQRFAGPGVFSFGAARFGTGVKRWSSHTLFVVAK